MLIISIIALLLVGVSAYLDDLDVDLGNLPMQNPGLYEGDIEDYDPNDRNVIPNLKRRWPSGIVPYIISPELKSYIPKIERAMNDYHKNTCVHFTLRKDETSYLKLYNGKGCHTKVGMRKGEHGLSLGKGCFHIGTIIHELGHAIGFHHEHKRSDRDDYITIYWQNIHTDFQSQFKKLRPDQNWLLTPFDYDSIMMYGNTAFSKDSRSPTMVANNGKVLVESYDKPGLSKSDIERVNVMYDCK